MGACDNQYGTTGTTTYTFTPGAGQCGTTATMNITIATQITPTFTQIGPLCQNSVAPLLPATSIEGITGTWAPATINTAALGTTTYTFTPGAGQCGTTATMNITIATQITPTFAQIGPLCQNSVAPLLPTTSIEGITGTWAPATINTAALGTTTYTFTPGAGQCGTTATMNITIATQITPTFAQIGPLCQNSVAPLLPATSIEGITGTWAPATINTAALGTTTYTFTPGAGQCGTTATMNITIATQITPTFAQIGPLCQNSVAPLLPATSIEGITGTWAPATINTAALGTTTYTFTPGAGQCGTPTTMNITISAQSHTNICPDRTTLSELSCTGYCRQLLRMVSPVHGHLRQSIRQLSVQHHMCLHLDRRSVRCACNHEYFDHNTDHTDICADRTTLPELSCSCTSS